MTQLLPCPFCGSTNVDPEGWASTDRAGPACDDCAGTADTVELWNSRPGDGWHPIDANTPPPLDKPVLLWFIGRNNTPAAHACTIGSASSHQPGEVWIDGDYKPIELFTHWQPLPTGPHGAAPHRDTRVEMATKALQKIAGLVDSEAGEPLDDAIKIANDALATLAVPSHPRNHEAT